MMYSLDSLPLSALMGGRHSGQRMALDCKWFIFSSAEKTAAGDLVL